MTIHKVHLVFKTHVDVGFTDFAAKILQLYREVYIPAALRTAAELRAGGGPERLIWTLPAWMVWNALEEGNNALRHAVERGIQNGDLTWHALPFTFHSELLEPSLFRHGLSVAQRLDRRFGRKTIAAKMTDVPGHTRGIVPILAEAGIEFLHIGVNDASRVPDVPPAFRWRAGGADVAVVYQHGYGRDFSLPGLGEALSFAHTNDNLGPQDAAAVRAAFEAARTAFPEGTLAASTLDDFAIALRPIRDTLPVIEDEIGDSWIHGAASDPAKLAGFRALSRLRARWIAETPAAANDPALTAFGDALLIVPEHTWSVDHKAYLDDWTSYAPEAFKAARQRPKFQLAESSWQEQRGYLTKAVATLDGMRRREAEAELAAIAAKPEPLAGSATIDGERISAGRFLLSVSPTGGLAQLVDQESGRRWNGAQDLIRLWREGFGAADYDLFWKAYNVNTDQQDVSWWAAYDFQKPGLREARLDHCFWNFELADLTLKQVTDGARLRVALRCSEEAVASGAPRHSELRYLFRDRLPGFDLDLIWSEKQATRLPEATWLSFDPAVSHPQCWSLDKMGQRISPTNVVRNGGTTLHGVDKGASYAGPDGRIDFRTLDAALIAPGQPRLLDYRSEPSSAKGGLHINLHNNVWGTNFPAWYDDDARFRFQITLEA